MNRLSPLILRRVGPFLPGTGRVLELWIAPGNPRSCPGDTISIQHMRSMVEGSARPIATTIPLPEPEPFAGAAPARWLEDLKLFATGWIGGLVFFGTLLG